MYLDLKYKKLWFRLAHPKGRIKKTALKITEQIAIIEAKIFFDKDDAEPVSGFIAQRNAGGRPGSLYIEAAQYAAENQALTDAGFGIQFCDVSQGGDAEPLDAGIPVSAAKTGVAAAAPANENVQAAEIIREIPPAPAVENRQADGEETVPAQAAESTQEEMPAQPDAQTVYEIFGGRQPQEAVPPAPDYTAKMNVDEILALMTPEDAAAVVVDTGTCKDWTLAQVAEKRPASLKWYLNGYTGNNNILRAGAKLLLDGVMERKAS